MALTTDEEVLLGKVVDAGYYYLATGDLTSTIALITAGLIAEDNGDEAEGMRWYATAAGEVANA